MPKYMVYLNILNRRSIKLTSEYASHGKYHHELRKRRIVLNMKRETINSVKILKLRFY